MNLLKLLKVGRSLNGGKALFGKYKMTQQSLPRFASTVRPSRTAPALESLLEKAKSVAPTDIIAPNNPVREVASPALVISVLDKTQRIPAGKIMRRMEEPVLKKDKVSFLSRMENNISKWKKKLTPARSKNKFGSAPVQAEWALGQVTVARNDLNEADLEVIAPKQVGQSRKTQLPDLREAKVSSSRWIRKTTSLFKTNSPFAQRSVEKKFEAHSSKAPKQELVGKI